MRKINFIKQSKAVSALTAVVVCLMFIQGCTDKKSEEKIILPPLSAISVNSSWGVVTSNYLRMREQPAKDAKVVTGLTKGMIVEIVSSTGKEETIEEETAVWYNISIEGFRGWMFGAYLKIFISAAAAKKYAEEIR